MKPYSLGLMVGRFQTFHKGHQAMIDQALALCETVGVFIGSSQESGTSQNPFSFELRREIISSLYGDRLRICPLPDIGVGNNAQWGDYVIDNALRQLGAIPDLFISGKENRRIDWLSSAKGAGIAELYIPKTIEISGSEMRGLIIRNDVDAWKSYCDPRLWHLFPELQRIVLASCRHTETSSL